MGRFKCKTTADEKIVDAETPKDAVDVFMKEMTGGRCRYKLKKVLGFQIKNDPDAAITVTDMSTEKKSYFQFTMFIG